MLCSAVYSTYNVCLPICAVLCFALSIVRNVWLGVYGTDQVYKPLLSLSECWCVHVVCSKADEMSIVHALLHGLSSVVH